MTGLSCQKGESSGANKKMRRNLVTAISMLTIALAGRAQQASSSPAVPVLQSNQPSPSLELPIGPRDVLDVRVLQDPTLNTHTIVGDDGKITFPLIGKIDVSGLTQPQAEARIKSLLQGKYLTTADVSVQIVEAGNKPISVIGSVTHPGRIGATGSITLMQAITQAGGLAVGSGRMLYVLRTGTNGLAEQIAIDLEDLLVNGNPDVNIPLFPNDVVNVPVDTPMNIYVLGEVMKPGRVQFHRSQNPTLLQALADAGGLTDRASRDVQVKRVLNGKESIIRKNYKRILSGQDPDVPLLDNDTIYVRESVF
jgi:polysaccharide export outer membrane protein